MISKENKHMNSILEMLRTNITTSQTQKKCSSQVLGPMGKRCKERKKWV